MKLFVALQNELLMIAIQPISDSYYTTILEVSVVKVMWKITTIDLARLSHPRLQQNLMAEGRKPVLRWQPVIHLVLLILLKRMLLFREMMLQITKVYPPSLTKFGGSLKHRSVM